MQAPHRFIFDKVSLHQTIPCALPAGEVVEVRRLCTKRSYPPYLQVEPVEKEQYNNSPKFFHIRMMGYPIILM